MLFSLPRMNSRPRRNEIRLWSVKNLEKLLDVVHNLVGGSSHFLKSQPVLRHVTVSPSPIYFLYFKATSSFVRNHEVLILWYKD